jgi:hypothetical protein
LLLSLLSGEVAGFHPETFGHPVPVACRHDGCLRLLATVYGLWSLSVVHSGSIAWNSFRQRWVTVFMQAGGKPSAFGELWYAEAGSPTGPWGNAVKILSHENYTFYNPRLHPELTPDDSPVLLFEGTYTQQFANRPVPTPRYDYNQILYRLDLDDPALKPAQGR